MCEAVADRIPTLRALPSPVSPPVYTSTTGTPLTATILDKRNLRLRVIDHHEFADGVTLLQDRVNGPPQTVPPDRRHHGGDRYLTHRNTPLPPVGGSADSSNGFRPRDVTINIKNRGNA